MNNEGLMQEINKIKYHQKLMLIVATSTENEPTNFFENVIANDVSEEQVKDLINLVKNGDLKTLESYIQESGVRYAPEYFLRDLIEQEMLTDKATTLLSKINGH